MKQLTPLLFISIITFLFSCGRLNEKKRPTAKKDSLVKQPAEKAEEQTRSEKEWDEYYRADSILMAGVLKEAIEIANKNIKASTFKKEFELSAGSYSVKTRLAMNNFFSGRFKHLIVHLSQPWTGGVNYEYIHIYLKEGNSFTKVVSYRQLEMTYVTDMLQDVNGDGLNDFLINWYGSNGCCLKSFYDVYLYQPQSGTFSEGYEFINPTFSSKEKVIRGVEYCHPGNTRMYKYKWNGLQVDTLEYVFFEKNDKGDNTGKFIRDVVLNNNPETTRMEKFNQVPAEYKRIYGYDWFLGKF